MFRGTSHHSIDAKGRTSLPVEYRAILTERSEDSLFLTQGPDRCLWGFAPGDWKSFEEKLLKLSQFRSDVRDLIDGLVSPAKECPVDKMGRILVPPELRGYAGLEGDIVFAGALDRIRVWSGARWKQRQEHTIAKFDAGAFEKLADFGI